ncbi:hypothetical protein [Microvirga puerhi]|uniref:Uncharacterized protein n=1 Tax=Microvirga puerhi TaxID=2876078 RepID=A0ABS7VTN0_9HYPH|nr:hypothetical protein [Microvirga puerhi]MBZ6078914.1 hypothetical protein [Microvirga puerhi]
MDLTNVFYDTLSTSLFRYKGGLDKFIDSYVAAAAVKDVDGFRQAFRFGNGGFSPAWLLPWFIARETSALAAYRFNWIGHYLQVECEPVYKREDSIAYLDKIRMVPRQETQRDIGRHFAYLYVSIVVDAVWDTLESTDTLRFASSLVVRSRGENKSE